MSEALADEVLAAYLHDVEPLPAFGVCSLARDDLLAMLRELRSLRAVLPRDKHRKPIPPGAWILLDGARLRVTAVRWGTDQEGAPTYDPQEFEIELCDWWERARNCELAEDKAAATRTEALVLAEQVAAKERMEED